MFEGIAAIVCNDSRFLMASKFEAKSCPDMASKTARQCWSDMQPILPDFGLGSASFEEPDNQAIFVAVMTQLEKCTVATLLLFDGNLEELVPTESMGGQSNAGDRASTGEFWGNFVEVLEKKFLHSTDAISEIIRLLRDGNIRSFALAPNGDALAVSWEETIVAPEDVSEYENWVELLNSVQSRIATINSNSEVYVFSREEVVTRDHLLTVSYTTAFDPDLPDCQAEFSGEERGSCELGRNDGHRALIHWKRLEQK